MEQSKSIDTLETYQTPTGSKEDNFEGEAMVLVGTTMTLMSVLLVVMEMILMIMMVSHTVMLLKMGVVQNVVIEMVEMT